MEPLTTERLTPADVERAAELLRSGGTVALPTETVYGLGADAASDEAVAKIFSAKGRPPGHPLIVHVSSTVAVEDWAELSDPRAGLLAETFWPGPLTLILPRTDRVSDLVVGGRENVGIRVPAHPVALALLAAFAEIGSGGVAAPSANRFGHVSPTTAAHVLADLDGRIDAVIDGGSARVGVESTILEIIGTDVALLRPGGISVAQIEAVLGEAVVDARRTDSRAAGMLESHYAPRAIVQLVESVDRSELKAGVGVIGPVEVEHPNVWFLADDAEAYARGLYAALRAADQAGMARVLIVRPSRGELLDAVLDRLAKASAQR